MYQISVFIFKHLFMNNSNISPFSETVVKTRDKAICCDLYSKWIHMKYNSLNDLDYQSLQRKGETWYCKTCIQEILSFFNKKINPKIINLENAGIDSNVKIISCWIVILKKVTNDNKSPIYCKHSDVSYFSKLDVELRSKCLSSFHLNINWISKKR